MNLYGFATGDPVTYSDPFGLCTPQWLCDLLDNANKGYHDYMRAIGLESGPIEGGSGRAYALGIVAGGVGLAAGAGELGGARSAANAARLRSSLSFEEASAIFTKTGELKPEVIAGSSLRIAGSELKNPEVIKLLTADGSKISDWGKYTTKSFASPSGKFKVHFYYNRLTGAVQYGADYKSVFNKLNGWF